jgi:hypothetical protein
MGTGVGSLDTVLEPTSPVLLLLIVSVLACWKPLPTGMVTPWTMMDVRTRK